MEYRLDLLKKLCTWSDSDFRREEWRNREKFVRPNWSDEELDTFYWLSDAIGINGALKSPLITSIAEKRKKEICELYCTDTAWEKVIIDNN